MAPLPEMIVSAPASAPAPAFHEPALEPAPKATMAQSVPMPAPISRKTKRDDADLPSGDAIAPAKRIRAVSGQLSPASSPPTTPAVPVSCIPSTMSAPFFQPQPAPFAAWPLQMPMTVPLSTAMASPAGMMAPSMSLGQQLMLGGFLRPGMSPLYPMMAGPTISTASAMSFAMPPHMLNVPSAPVCSAPAVMISSTHNHSCASVADGDGKVCTSCDTAQTPMWREGYQGMPLCNACGIRFKKYGIQCRHCNYVPRKYERTSVVCRKCQLASAHVVRPIRQRGPNFTFQRDFD